MMHPELYVVRLRCCRFCNAQKNAHDQTQCAKYVPSLASFGLDQDRSGDMHVTRACRAAEQIRETKRCGLSAYSNLYDAPAYESVSSLTITRDFEEQWSDLVSSGLRTRLGHISTGNMHMPLGSAQVRLWPHCAALASAGVILLHQRPAHAERARSPHYVLNEDKATLKQVHMLFR